MAFVPQPLVMNSFYCRCNEASKHYSLSVRKQMQKKTLIDVAHVDLVTCNDVGS